MTPSEKQTDLALIQKWMQSVLIPPDEQNFSFNPEDFVNSSKRLSAARHLFIYRKSYIARLRECMKNQFSALAFALGEELFQMFADEYLQANPSDSYTLNDLGKRFPDFLQETRPDKDSVEKESWIDFMIELARFEFTLSEVFDAPADEVISAEESTADEKLKLAPLARIFRHRFPVCRYYLDVTRKKNPELPFKEESFCAVARFNYRLNLLEIKPAQYFFLEKIVEGLSISEAKNFSVENYGFDAEKLDIAWKEWRKVIISAGFFCVSA